MILKTNRKYKTIKHIILCWGERELLRYPYPIILSPTPKGFWPEGYVPEISHFYRGTSFSIYFTANYEYPMHLKTKFPQMEFVSTSDEEEELEYDRPPQPVSGYDLYFISFRIALRLSSYSVLVYDIYSEMFAQSQIIVKNMDLDKQDLFEGIEDIKIDVSKPSYREAVLEVQRRERSLTELGYARPEPGSVESYYQAQTYRYGLEESKNVFLTHLGEENVEGYSGLNENFFKPYTLRLQLVLIFLLHHDYVVFFSAGERSEKLESVNLWKEPLFVEHTYRDFNILLNLSNAEHFYLRRFYRKFNVLNR